MVGVTNATLGSWVRAGKLKPAGRAGRWYLFSADQVDLCRGLVGVRFVSAGKLAARVGVSEETLLGVEKPECYSPDGVPMYRSKDRKELVVLKKRLGL